MSSAFSTGQAGRLRCDDPKIIISNVQNNADDSFQALEKLLG